MSSSVPWLAVLGAALLAGAVGGVLGRYAAPAPKLSRATSSSSPETEPADTSALDRRVSDLEKTVARLEREQRMAKIAAGWGSAAPSDSDSDAGPSAPHLDDPVFQTAVRDVVDQIEEERRGERQARWEERRKQVAERWSARLGEKLGLTEAQKQKIAEIVQDYFKEMRAERDSDAGPMSREEWRQKAAGARKKSEAKLGQVLDPAQRQKYDELDEDEKIGFGMGRRRRGGGGEP